MSGAVSFEIWKQIPIINIKQKKLTAQNDSYSLKLHTDKHWACFRKGELTAYNPQTMPDMCGFASSEKCSILIQFMIV